ncbi:hypothetical protein D3C78_1447710 [compost metagenome]
MQVDYGDLQQPLAEGLPVGLEEVAVDQDKRCHAHHQAQQLLAQARLDALLGSREGTGEIGHRHGRQAHDQAVDQCRAQTGPTGGEQRFGGAIEPEFRLGGLIGIFQVVHVALLAVIDWAIVARGQGDARRPASGWTE